MVSRRPFDLLYIEPKRRMANLESRPCLRSEDPDYRSRWDFSLRVVRRFNTLLRETRIRRSLAPPAFRRTRGSRHRRSPSGLLGLLRRHGKRHLLSRFRCTASSDDLLLRFSNAPVESRVALGADTNDPQPCT